MIVAVNTWREGGRDRGREGASKGGSEGGREGPGGSLQRARERGAQVLAQASEIAEAEIASRSSKRAAQRLLATGAFARGGAGLGIGRSVQCP